MRETDHAWAAGFFDGEGCVLVVKAKSPAGSRGMKMTLVVSVSQLDRRPLDKLKRLYGGTIHQQKKAAPTQSGRVNLPYRWHLQGEAVRPFLEGVFPYCLVKKEQIDIALEWPVREGRSCKALSDENFSHRLFIYERLKAMKMRGTPAAVV